MRSNDIIREVSQHLAKGGNARLIVDKNGRRYVKLLKWGGLFNTKRELTGATAVTIEHMLHDFSRRERGTARQPA